MDTLQEVLSWTKPHGVIPKHLRPRSTYALLGHHLCQDAISPESLQFVPSASAPRTLFCHDLKGGYGPDRFVHGREGLEEMPYVFRHWSCIDTFVYFSHRFVTIPPVGWISAAHANGVKVLGTVITEWDRGAELCHEFLAEENLEAFATSLVRIAVEEGFEGWLFNIENVLDVEKGEVEKMQRLVRLLTDKMHRAVSGSEVIWYDSVTTEGKLEWQNELNTLNKPFFDACDGIFLNYTWKTGEERDEEGKVLYHDSLKASIDALAEGEKERKFDIYVGIDVFGRGCYGGGGFNCNKALEFIR